MTTRRRVLVTGGNAGIGLAAAEQLAEAGYDVLLGCRDAARGASAVEAIARAVPGASVSVLALDMASQASIRVAAAPISLHYGFSASAPETSSGGPPDRRRLIQ